MLINILIRTSHRPDQFKRCIDSVRRQSHSELRVIVGYDNSLALNYIPEDLERVEMKPESGRYFFNRYCNQLKSLVTDGWFFFLDDDDYIIHYKTLEILGQELTEDYGMIICQFLRGGIRKQKDSYQDAKKVEIGHVGLPCGVVNHKHKNLHDLNGEFDFGDWEWIKKMSQSVKTKWVKIPVVYSEKRNNGKMETTFSYTWTTKEGLEEL